MNTKPKYFKIKQQGKYHYFKVEYSNLIWHVERFHHGRFLYFKSFKGMKDLNEFLDQARLNEGYKDLNVHKSEIMRDFERMIRRGDLNDNFNIRR